MKTSVKLIWIFAGAVALLTACQQTGDNDRMNTASVPADRSGHAGHGVAPPANLNSPSIIPSQNGQKIRTTNEHGGTTYGLGTSVYSLIGSSSLHSDGFSSHLESRLGGEGISGVKAFVFDDTVILATESRQPTSSQYDPLQQKVLSHTGGQSARGPEPARPLGVRDPGEPADDNLAQAEQRVKAMMGGNVRILTVTGRDALQTIDRIRSNVAASASPQALSDDLRTLLKLASANAK